MNLSWGESYDRKARKVALSAKLEEFYNQCNSAEDGRFCEGSDGPGRKRDPGSEDLGEKGLVSDTKANEKKLEAEEPEEKRTRKSLTAEEEKERDSIMEEIKAQREKEGKKPLAKASLNAYAIKELRSRQEKGTKEDVPEAPKPKAPSESKPEYKVVKDKIGQDVYIDAKGKKFVKAVNGELVDDLRPSEVSGVGEASPKAGTLSWPRLSPEENTRRNEIADKIRKSREASGHPPLSDDELKNQVNITHKNPEVWDNIQPKSTTPPPPPGAEERSQLDAKVAELLRANPMLNRSMAEREAKKSLEGERIVRTQEGAERYGESVGQEIEAEPLEPPKERGFLKRLLTRDTPYEQAQQNARQAERARQRSLTPQEREEEFLEGVSPELREQLMRRRADRAERDAREAQEEAQKRAEKAQRDAQERAEKAQRDAQKTRRRQSSSSAANAAIARRIAGDIKRVHRAAQKTGGDLRGYDWRGRKLKKGFFNGETEEFMITTKEEAREFGLPLGTVVELHWEEQDGS